jgi:acetate kinase
LAVEIFCYRVRKYVGAYLAAMGGADALVFTGGIGENSAEVRARVCEGLGWMGVELDAALNEAMTGRREGIVSREGSRLAVYVIPTDEELLIARDTVRLIRGVTQRF